MKEEKRRRAPVFRTIVSAAKVTAKAGNAFEVLFSIAWLGVGAVSAYTSVINANFFDEAANMLDGQAGAFSRALVWLAVWTAAELLIAAVTMVNSRVDAVLRQKISYYTENTVMKKIVRIKLKYFEDREAQKKIRFCKHNLGGSISDVTSASIGMVRCAISFVTALIILLGVSPLIAAVVIACTVPGIILQRINQDKHYALAQWNSFEGQMQRYLALVISKRKYIKEMRFYQLYDYMEGKYERSVKELNDQQLKLQRAELLSSLVSNVLLFGSIAAALALISAEIFAGRAQIGSFILVYTSVQNVQDALIWIFGNLGDITDRGRYLEDYETVLSYEEEGGENADGKADALEIQFEHVSFTYPGTDREVLKDVSLTIRQGEKIAIVGENGSGKSTFVKLLEGLYDVSKGRILVNGVDISRNLGLLRRMLSCTSQEFLHFEGTLAENIRIGDPTRTHTDGEVRAAMQKSGIDADAAALSNGMDTLLGNFVPGGVDLSGGQWQKVAMSRNLIKDDARLLVMDEPTAALDPLAESKLYREFQSLTQDKTVLLISHRLGATQIADRVLVFDDGRIVEDGTHEALLAAGGLYAKMYQAQAQWYQNA